MNLPISLSFEDGQWKAWHARQGYGQLIFFGSYPSLEKALIAIGEATGKIPYVQAAFGVDMVRVET